MLACSRLDWNASKAQASQQRESIQLVSKLVKVGNGIVPFITVFMPSKEELHPTETTSELRCM